MYEKVQPYNLGAVCLKVMFVLQKTWITYKNQEQSLPCPMDLQVYHTTVSSGCDDMYCNKLTVF